MITERVSINKETLERELEIKLIDEYFLGLMWFFSFLRTIKMFIIFTRIGNLLVMTLIYYLSLLIFIVDLKLISFFII